MVFTSYDSTYFHVCLSPMFCIKNCKIWTLELWHSGEFYRKFSLRALALRVRILTVLFNLIRGFTCTCIKTSPALGKVLNSLLNCKMFKTVAAMVLYRANDALDMGLSFFKSYLNDSWLLTSSVRHMVKEQSLLLFNVLCVTQRCDHESNPGPFGFEANALPTTRR